MFVRNDHYKKMYTCNIASVPKSSDLLSVPTPFDPEEAAHLFPTDPSTGQIRDLLSQILTTENPLLRDTLLSKLQSVSADSSSLKGVDDATKLQLLKPRTVQSLSDMAEYAQFVGSVLEDLNVPPTPDPSPAPDPVPAPDPSPSE